jgi:NAD-dependent dihydropyrimidine dehydrogenase PreA subunit
MVGGFPTGLVGLEELFGDLFAAGVAPEPSLGPDLVRRAAVHNYIAPGHEEEFAEALLREYRRYWKRRTGQEEERPVRQAPRTWRGRPREEVPWYPTVYADRCDGCGDCLTFCSYGVFAREEGSGKVVVVEPFHCVVGCEACARVCKRGAIAFPPRGILAAFEQPPTR